MVSDGKPRYIGRFSIYHTYIYDAWNLMDKMHNFHFKTPIRNCSPLHPTKMKTFNPTTTCHHQIRLRTRRVYPGDRRNLDDCQRYHPRLKNTETTSPRKSLGREKIIADRA